MQRRTFLAGASALAVSGCAATAVTPGSNPSPTPTQAAADIALIAQGLHSAIPLLTAPAANPGLQPATAAKVQSLIADIQAASSAFTVADTAAAQQPLATRIGTDLSQIGVAIASEGSAAVPTGFSNYLAAAEVLLPAVEITLGMVAPTAIHPAAPMTPARARDILRGAR